MRFVSLGSGSNGNCTLISYNDANILVDCGFSFKRIQEALSNYKLNFNDIDAVCITHAHSDHIHALDQICKRTNVKIYGNAITLKQYMKKYTYDALMRDKLKENLFIVNDDAEFNIKNICIRPFNTFHDVTSTFYNFVLGNELEISILTDTGHVDDYILTKIKNSNAILLESNYNEEMLKSCEKYQDSLKKRIMSRKGHLSNEDCADVIMKINNPQLKIVALGHISDNSNTYELAYNSVVNRINEMYKENIPLPKIIVAKRNEITEVLV